MVCVNAIFRAATEACARKIRQALVGIGIQRSTNFTSD